MASGMVLCGGVLVGGALVLDNFTFTVKPGQRGFVRENYLDFSSRGILNPGIHLYIPYLQVSSKAFTFFTNKIPSRNLLSMTPACNQD